jgi:hypothetical protein
VTDAGRAALAERFGLRPEALDLGDEAAAAVDRRAA